MQNNNHAQSMQGTRVVVFAGLFLAIAVLWQSLRFFIPGLVGPWNLFLIGSLVKATLVMALLVTRRSGVAGIAFLLPVVALLQGQLPVALLVPVVGMGSCVYALLAWHWWESKRVWLAPLVSAVVFFGGVKLVAACLALPAPLASTLSLMFSWPQLVTGSAGILLARLMVKRLGKYN